MVFDQLVLSALGAKCERFNFPQPNQLFNVCDMIVSDCQWICPSLRLSIVPDAQSMTHRNFTTGNCVKVICCTCDVMVMIWFLHSLLFVIIVRYYAPLFLKTLAHEGPFKCYVVDVVIYGPEFQSVTSGLGLFTLVLRNASFTR